jgi:UDP-glucose 4-epimerase
MFCLDKPCSVLILGGSGGLAHILSGLITKDYPMASITSVDSRPIKRRLKSKKIKYQQIKYTRGNFENLFRNNKFDVVVHLARMGHASSVAKTNLAQRLDLNLMGTNRILELSLKFGVKKLIVLSTFHVYGALSDNSVYIKEDSILKASIKYPDLRDVVEMDQMVSGWMWKNQGDIEAVVLRPCNIIGPQINNAISKYLKTKYMPLGVDFNPMFQFIHELDMANALLHSIVKLSQGIYNVAPKETISIKAAKEIMGQPTIPLPIFLLEQMTLVVDKLLLHIPNYLLEYIKFSCVIDGSSFLNEVGEDFFRFDTKTGLKLLARDSD